MCNQYENCLMIITKDAKIKLKPRLFYAVNVLYKTWSIFFSVRNQMQNEFNSLIRERSLIIEGLLNGVSLSLCVSKNLISAKL